MTKAQKAVRITPQLNALKSQLIKTIGVHEGDTPDTKGKPNRGRWVDIYCKFLGLLGVPWCACFVAFQLNKWAKSLSASADWPMIRPAAHCGWLANWLDKRNRLLPNPEQDVFIFFVWFPSKRRFAHVGFGYNPVRNKYGVVTAFTSVEGNSNIDGSAEGYEVASNQRSVNETMRFADIRLA